MKIFSGLLLYAAIAAPWYILMYNIHGSIFVDTFLGFHNITRFTSPEHPEGVLWYYYVPVLILGFFPWTGFIIQSIWSSLTKSTYDSSTLLFLNIWSLFIFAFFTISQTKLVSYILPMYPPLSMIVGWYIDRLWTSHDKSHFTSLSIGLSILTALFIGIMFIGIKAMPLLANGIYISAIIFILMSSLVAYFGWKNEIRLAFWTKIISMTLFSMVLTAILIPAAAPMFTTKNIAQEFNRQYDGKSPVYVVKFLRPGFAFYTNVYGKEIVLGTDFNELIQESQRSYFLIRKSEYDRLTVATRQSIIILSCISDKLLLLKE